MPLREKAPGVPVIAFAARLLHQKGVEEVVTAVEGVVEVLRFWSDVPLREFVTLGGECACRPGRGFRL